MVCQFILKSGAYPVLTPEFEYRWAIFRFLTSEIVGIMGQIFFFFFCKTFVLVSKFKVYWVKFEKKIPNFLV